VGARRSKRSAVRAEGNAVHRRPRFVLRDGEPSTGHVPEADIAVGTGRSHGAAVWAEGDPQGRIAILLAHAQTDRTARAHVPGPDDAGAVARPARRGGEHAPVRTERDPVDRALVDVDHASLPVALHVPEPDRAVGTGRRERAMVGAER